MQAQAGYQQFYNQSVVAIGRVAQDPSIDTDGKVKVDHYEYEPGYRIYPNMMQGELQYLVDNARGDNDSPRPNGENFEKIVWKRKSYIAFFADEEFWMLHNNKPGSEGVRFVTDIIGTFPNYTFYDADDYLLEVTNKTTGKTTKRSAIAFVNHMKRNQGGDDLIKGDFQPFKFEIIFDVKFAHTSQVGMTVIFDPDGTNEGPPIGPPPP